MKLSTLNPKFGKNPHSESRDYLIFYCPKCKDEPLGEYQIKHTYALPINGQQPSWTLSATQPADKMFNEPEWNQVSIMPSIQDLSRCHAHFFITNGEIVMV